MTLSNSDMKTLKLIESSIQEIQKFVDRNIVSTIAMPAKEIYAKMHRQNLCTLDETTFIKGFRLAISLGKITGIEGAKRAGYRRCGSKPKVISVVEEKLEEIESLPENDLVEDCSGCEIIINETTKLKSVDKYNWVLMVKKGSERWAIEGHFESLKVILRYLPHKLLDNELKNIGELHINELSQQISIAETKITTALENAIKAVTLA